MIPAVLLILEAVADLLALVAAVALVLFGDGLPVMR